MITRNGFVVPLLTGMTGTKVDKDKLRRWLCEERRLPAPVELKIGDAVGIRLEQLSRMNFHRPPARAKITNNGKTVVFSGKWKNTRPYIFGGPFEGKYVFSMLHFHWSQNNSKGSIHSVDGEKYPLEIHVVYFKAKYIFYEEAAKYEDGVIFEVHFFYIQEDINDSLSPLIEKLSDVHRSGTSVAVEESALARYVTVFTSDYFLYCGTIIDGKDRHRVTWIICRQASGVSSSQMNKFRQLLGQDGFPLIRNSHKIYKIGNRKIYHVNGSDYATEILYPFPKISHKKTEKLRIRFHFKPSNKVNNPTDSEQNKRKEEMKKIAYLQKIEDNASNKKMVKEKCRIVNLEENQYVEPVLGRRNIIDSVVQWLRNSVVQNREEITSLDETTEIEKETCSLEKESATQATSTSISGSITEVNDNIYDAITNTKKQFDNYSAELPSSVKSVDFQSVERNPQNTFCKSNFNVGKKKKKIHRRNKVKLFSDFESNFTQQVMNKSKLKSDGVHVTKAHENVLLYTKSMETIKKRIIEINSKQHVNLEHRKKETHEEHGKKLRQSNDRPQSSETLTKSLIAGFKNIYFKCKNDFDNRNSSNIINKPKLMNDKKKEYKACSTETKERSKDFFKKIIKDDHQSARGTKNHVKREKSDVKTYKKNKSYSKHSLNSVSFKNNCDKTCKNVTRGKLYYIEQDKKRKLKSDYKKLPKNKDVLTPLKSGLDFLPNNFKDINDLNGRKHQLREKSCQQQNEADIIYNDSITKKHKRTQTLKISNSSSSEPKNIIYISNNPKKHLILRRSSDTSIEKKVKFDNRVKKYSNHEIGTQYKKSARNDFKFSENFEKHTFGNVKVKETSSHESVYLFMKKSIDNIIDANSDTKKKTGILYEWLLSAKDLITGPRS